jgi:hypothetical protein
MFISGGSKKNRPLERRMSIVVGAFWGSCTSDSVTPVKSGVSSPGRLGERFQDLTLFEKDAKIAMV